MVITKRDFVYSPLPILVSTRTITGTCKVRFLYNPGEQLLLILVDSLNFPINNLFLPQPYHSLEICGFITALEILLNQEFFTGKEFIWH